MKQEEEEEEKKTEEKKKEEKRNYDFFLTAISRFYGKKGQMAVHLSRVQTPAMDLRTPVMDLRTPEERGVARFDSLSRLWFPRHR